MSTKAAEKPQTPEPTRLPAKPPEGFQSIGLPKIAGFLTIEPGLTVHGRYLGVISKADPKAPGDRKKDRHWIIFRLGAEVKGKEADDTSIERTFKVGETVAFDAKAKLRDILNYKTGGIFWFQIGNLRKLKDGRKQYDAEVFGMPENERLEQPWKSVLELKQVMGTSAETEPDEDDNIPF